MENTLDNVELEKEVKVTNIQCSRKCKKKNFRLRNNRRNKNKASTEKPIRRTNSL